MIEVCISIDRRWLIVLIVGPLLGCLWALADYYL